jgi:nicotinamidase-related amidase
LLIVDVQSGLFKKASPIYQSEQLLVNINALARRARRAGAFVVYIQHQNTTSLVKGSKGWRLHPRLHPLKGDAIIPKRHGNAFQDTVLDAELSHRRVRTIVVTGLVTYACVRATCAGAAKLGYQVILVSDGHSNYSADAAEVIESWNEKLTTRGIAEALPAAAIDFTGAASGRTSGCS